MLSEELKNKINKKLQHLMYDLIYKDTANFFIKEIINIIENSNLIELPVKVGDTIYCLEWSKYNQIKELKTEQIKDIRIDNSNSEETIIEFVYDYDYDEYGQNTISVYNDDYNKTWFTNKELAKKRLKELQRS